MKLITKSGFKEFTTYKNIRMYVVDMKDNRITIKVTSERKQLFLDMHITEFRDLIDSFFREMEKLEEVK